VNAQSSARNGTQAGAPSEPEPPRRRERRIRPPTRRGQAGPVVTLVGLFLALILWTMALAACSSSSSSPTSTRRPATLHLVAIGDSIPFGQHFCGNCATFDDLYAAHLRRTAKAKVSVENLSQDTEITSTDLRREMNSDAPMRAAVAQADIVTVSVGHNDTPWNSFTDPCDGHGGYPNADWASYRGTCVAKTAADYGRNLASVLAAITVLRAGKPTLVMVTNDYDDIIGDPAVPASADPVVARVVDAFAGTTCRIATAHHAVCIDTYRAFNGPTGRGDATALLEGDHTHPNESGHQLIARLLDRVPLGAISQP
jgi:lysophospholipase L1-like esterase